MRVWNTDDEQQRGEMKEKSCIMRGEGAIICVVVQKSSQVLSSSGSAELDPPAQPHCVHVVRLLLALLITPLMEQRHLLQLCFPLSHLKFSPPFCLLISFHPSPGAKGREWGDGAAECCKRAKMDDALKCSKGKPERAGGKDATN